MFYICRYCVFTLWGRNGYMNINSLSENYQILIHFLYWWLILSENYTVNIHNLIFSSSDFLLQIMFINHYLLCIFFKFVCLCFFLISNIQGSFTIPWLFAAPVLPYYCNGGPEVKGPITGSGRHPGPCEGQNLMFFLGSPEAHNVEHTMEIWTLFKYHYQSNFYWYISPWPIKSLDAFIFHELISDPGALRRCIIIHKDEVMDIRHCRCIRYHLWSQHFVDVSLRSEPAINYHQLLSSHTDTCPAYDASTIIWLHSLNAVRIQLFSYCSPNTNPTNHSPEVESALVTNKTLDHWRRFQCWWCHHM